MAKNKRKRKKTSLPKRFIVGLILAALFLISAAVFVICCVKLGMIPVTYILIFVMAAIAITEGILFANRWKAGGIVVNIISGILIVVLLLASYYMNVVSNTVVAVQSSDYTTVYIGVYVMDDDTALELADTAGYTFGYDSVFDTTSTAEALHTCSLSLTETLSLRIMKTCMTCSMNCMTGQSMQ